MQADNADSAHGLCPRSSSLLLRRTTIPSATPCSTTWDHPLPSTCTVPPAVPPAAATAAATAATTAVTDAETGQEPDDALMCAVHPQPTMRRRTRTGSCVGGCFRRAAHGLSVGTGSIATDLSCRESDLARGSELNAGAFQSASRTLKLLRHPKLAVS